MAGAIELIRGDTWRISCARRDSAGAAIPIAGTVASELVSGPVRQAFTVDVTNASGGEFVLIMDASVTAQLGARTYTADVEFTESGFVESTETFSITVLRDVTNAG